MTDDGETGTGTYPEVGSANELAGTNTSVGLICRSEIFVSHKSESPIMPCLSGVTGSLQRR